MQLPRKAFVTLLLPVLFCSCVSFWREPANPEESVAAPPSFSAPATSENSPSEHPSKKFMGSWWKAFGDEQLESYLEEVIEGNLGFQQALWRIKQLEAAHGVQLADVFPSVSLGAEISRTRQDTTVPEVSSGPGGVSFQDVDKTIHTTLTQFSLNFGYELDLFGRVHNLAQAAEQAYRAAVYSTVDLCQKTLVQATLGHYLYVEAAQQLQLTQKNVTLSEDYLKLVERRYALGQASVLEVNQARDSLLSVQTLVPVYQDALDEAASQKALLAGRFHSPQGNKIEKELGLPESALAIELEAPLAVLQSRPDVLASLHQVQQADHDAAAALAARFPRLSFTARMGYPAESFEEVFAPERFFWQLVANLTAPLFMGGKLKAAQEGKEAVLAERTAAYKETVIKALTEVERAAARLASTRERVRLTDTLLVNSTLTLKLATEKYRQGLSPFLNVLTARQGLFQAERNLISVKREALESLVRLIHVTGGLWLPGEVIRKTEERDLPLEELDPPLPSAKTTSFPSQRTSL